MYFFFAQHFLQWSTKHDILWHVVVNNFFMLSAKIRGHSKTTLVGGKGNAEGSMFFIWQQSHQHKLGLVADPAIKAIARLEFEDGWRTVVLPGDCWYPCGSRT